VALQSGVNALPDLRSSSAFVGQSGEAMRMRRMQIGYEKASFACVTGMKARIASTSFPWAAFQAPPQGSARSYRTRTW